MEPEYSNVHYCQNQLSQNLKLQTGYNRCCDECLHVIPMISYWIFVVHNYQITLIVPVPHVK